MISPGLLKRMCDARRRLQCELEPPASVAHLAAEARLSTSHFISQFSALFGETPLQCRTRARLERAREMLVSTDEPATQIGLALGFASQGSFSRLFSRHFGMPPRRYRRTAEPFVAPLGCIALMNQAHARDLDFGEVARGDVGQDGGPALR
ncbi:AraC family transcriptional regulator [Variovorax sp. NFACC27]|uniref:helix-turn-helix transcriptional regulator n=1 Tax=unclassified Variovorax TaxID=663243 RepID=UPI00089CFCB8|nr:AraC family transcriptional regulator [Variovorax sp. YR750]SEF32310.1 AraC-type DNA-binding protein [Variovorax sp. NFACC28]SEG91133.1 AraC-type DNA-binding protein [Variovorax sp. NFACC29]SFD47941.1 AraC-type DNA-binding protein [Variovorax sp. NFACC26]SFG73533.1 AraC-type DNA-binding protein [Variovorax sp. NFACC27]SEL46058.1 AraC-type DNA-binding protein [Variovorax sp. YR750]